MILKTRALVVISLTSSFAVPFFLTLKSDVGGWMMEYYIMLHISVLLRNMNYLTFILPFPVLRR